MAHNMLKFVFLKPVLLALRMEDIVIFEQSIWKQ